MKKVSEVMVCLAVLFFYISSAVSGEITSLSKKAARLKIGMSRQDVINLLGNPWWVVIPTDKGDFYLSSSVALGLYWKNTPCSPVAVDFDNTYKVTGWDEGRGLCGNEASLFEPSEEYSCGKEDRAGFCK